MELQRVAPTVGIVACLVVVAVVAAPALLVSAPGVAAYYAAGPTGLGTVGALAAIAVVVFLAGRQGRTPPDTAAGVALVLGFAIVGLATLWATSLDPTVLYSFPPEYAWLEYHQWAVPGSGALVFVSGVAYANAVL
jgi:hypothetical protein